MASDKHVFETGSKRVKMFAVETEKSYTSPPKPLLVLSPEEEGMYHVVVSLHGYLLHNSSYSQLFNHVASHGFIVIGPQLYVVSGADATEEIKSAALVLDWLAQNLASILPPHVQPDISKLSIAGHSRGGKVAFALSLGKAASSPLKLSVLIGIDPVDGMDIGQQTPPPVLTYTPNSLKLNMPVLVVGSGLCDIAKEVSHEQFFTECCAPACYFVAKDYGHLDMLDDETMELGGAKHGKDRKPMRLFVGGIMVAFLKAYLENEKQFLMAIKDDPGVSPVELSTCSLLE